MQNKFTQPVSMQVTKEQYEKGLREPLLRMGYKEGSELFWTDDSNCIVTNLDGKDCRVGILDDAFVHRYNRHFIDHYNPKLFLAIAAMTDREFPIVGEWFVYTDNMVEQYGYEAWRLYKNENPNRNVRCQRKATLQELITNLTENKQKNIMQNKFTQPVSMQVTKEQYEKGLREPLLRMGYLELGVAEWVAAPVLVTNYNTGFCISNTINEYKKRHNRYFVPEYNPKLFLAIAAMSNVEYGIYGEWWYCTEDVKMEGSGKVEYNRGKLYMGLDNERIINNSRGYNHYWGGDYRFEYFRKATLQELITNLTENKQKTL